MRIYVGTYFKVLCKLYRKRALTDRNEFMEIESRTIILSTPEELLPLITEAIRTAEHGKTADVPDLPGKKLLAPKDVEREFGIHQKTLAYWRMEGVGPAYTNFGRRVFYERAVLEEYIASGRVQTSDSTR